MENKVGDFPEGKPLRKELVTKEGKLKSRRRKVRALEEIKSLGKKE